MKASVVVLFFNAVALATLQVTADENSLDIDHVTVYLTSTPKDVPVFYAVIFTSEEDARTAAASVSGWSKMMKARVACTADAGAGAGADGTDTRKSDARRRTIAVDGKAIDTIEAIGDSKAREDYSKDYTRGRGRGKHKRKGGDKCTISATDDSGLKHPKSMWIAAGLFGLTIFLTAATALIIRNMQKRACDKKTSFSNKP